MSPSKLTSPLKFVKDQLDLVRQQQAAILTGDYNLAIMYGRRIEAGGAEMANLIADQKNRNWSDQGSEEMREMIREIRRIQLDLLNILEPGRERLKELLLDVKQGRKLLTAYRQKGPRRKVFELRA